MILIYKDGLTFYAKDEKEPINLKYVADIGTQFIKFLENEYTETPYILLDGFEEKEEEYRKYFRDYFLGLLCDEIIFYDLNGTQINNPKPIELLMHDENFKKEYKIKHFAYKRKDGSIEIRTAYVVSNLWEALYVELIKLIESGKLVKRCEHCDRLFFPKDRVEKYCDRQLANGKTCKDVGYLSKVENDQLLKSYHTAYKTRHAEKQRKSRNKSAATKKKYEEALDIWRKKARELLHNAKKEKTELAINEFMNFLNITLDNIINNNLGGENNG